MTAEFLGSRLALVMCLFSSLLGVYFLVTHTGHVLTALPYLFLLACPLLHLFGHGHGGHRHANKSEKTEVRN